MSAPLVAIEALLLRGDVTGALDEFAKLRPGLKGTLEALKLVTRIYAATKNWEKVDVLCRVMRNEFPADVSGFEQGAESLHNQGRNAEAINLLKLWNIGVSHSDTLHPAMVRYEAAIEPTAPGAALQS
jgi:uncharacterized protein HemY